MIIFAAFSVATEQFYKITKHPLFQTIAGIFLIGTAVTMSSVIISKVMMETRKNNKL